MHKPLVIGIQALQVILIGFLVIKVIGLSEQVTKLESFSSQHQDASTTNRQSNLSSEDILQQAGFCNSVSLRPQQLSQITQAVTQNLINYIENNRALFSQLGSVKKYPMTEKQMAQYDVVNQKIDAFISNGAVSDSELENIYLSLAQLHINDRKSVLKRISTSINSGVLKIK